ncbi:hypothetical protein AARAC_001021 [Aspergillus arachidicola]|uniref:Uncharacterized protein n=1 Tax=Aspergillus arachidicola TaxID=656916 RepID=A0A2G7G6Z5_9EURO|nr:hypothetical protein AARAC_001021 [Aspergillus arachidicola]
MTKKVAVTRDKDSDDSEKGIITAALGALRTDKSFPSAGNSLAHYMPKSAPTKLPGVVGICTIIARWLPGVSGTYMAMENDSPATLKAIRNIISATTFNDWESVPFPTPLHIDFDYVYKIDKDLGILIITKWSGADGVLSRLVRQAKLAEIQDPSLITVEVVLRNVEDFLKQYSTQDDQTQSFAALKVDIGIPSSLNEHQFRFFPDFVLLWKFYFDDVATWVGEPLLNTLAIAILRTAALDFEVLLDTDTD